MQKKQLFIILILTLCTVLTTAQTDASDSFKMPNQTFLRFNKNLINPTFSVFNPYQTEIVVYHKNQWFEYDDAPKTYMISYVINNYEKSGYGLQVYQQQIGIWQSTGGIATYAKGVRLNENSMLSLGFNAIYFNSDLNRGKIVTGMADPLFEQYDASSVLMLNPGVSLQMGSFNLGFYGNNLVDYNFKQQETQTPFNKKTISGHLNYSHVFKNGSNVFENSSLTFIGQGNYEEMDKLNYTTGILYNVPKMGWLQTGYSDFYGISGGLGITVSQKIAVGYNYEKAIKNEVVNLGATHEFFLALTLNSNKEQSIVSKKQEELILEEALKKQTLEQEEIDRFKQNIYNKTIVATDQNTIQKLEEFIKNATLDNINYLIPTEENINVKKGYYIVATTYKNKNKAIQFINSLKSDGFTKSGYFETTNKWYYIYIERFDDYENAKNAYKSKFNATYNQTIWIVPIL